MPHFEEIGNKARGRHIQELASAFAEQGQRLAQYKRIEEDDETGATQAVEAKFVTPLDPVVVTADGRRLPSVPVDEARKLNALRDELDGRETPRSPPRSAVRVGKDGMVHGARLQSPPGTRTLDEKLDEQQDEKQAEMSDAPLREAVPLSRTNPLFPPLPMYGPPTTLRTVQCWFFRAISSVLSLYFLLAIVIGAISAAIPRTLKYMRQRALLDNPTKRRPFYQEEVKRAQERKTAQREWVQQQKGKGTQTPSGEKATAEPQDGEFVPTEGGPDPLCVDVAYYARRVGLDAETFDVQTEDGFIIELIHLFNPREYRKPPPKSHEMDGPDNFVSSPHDPGFAECDTLPDGQKKYPVLMMHGLLQSAGAYCCTDDDSLAFYLAKSGYDVWLGNSRCGFAPRHTLLHPSDPRMWAWNIRQMGVMDLAAFISRVLAVTGFPQLALVAHSQGTTQTFVALAKEQRPDLGAKISVFCALAPAAYAGPLIGKIYFKLMRLVTPAIFRLIFGIHAFIPLMLTAHAVLPGKAYSWMGYHVFSFLFSWSDTRWDTGLRDRMFQWAPTAVSAESMRWWLGRECFARQKCILATREEGALEDKEDEEDDEVIRRLYVDREPHVTERRKLQRNLTSFHCAAPAHLHCERGGRRGEFAWYDAQFPPLALWVCGADDLVDGRRLLRRFDRGREPHVRIVHQKIIEGYEHLDVIWAMDAIEKVGKEVREVIWRTVDEGRQGICRVPVGCRGRLEEETPEGGGDVPMMHSGGRLRMASLSEQRPAWLGGGGGGGGEDGGAADAADGGVGMDGIEEDGGAAPSTQTDASKEKAGEHDHLCEEEERFGRGAETTEERKRTGRQRAGSEALFTDVQEKGNPLG
ncbi:hypothetical protein LTR36_002723 [Oleoguttula mirabilis]|uniref:Partial AB-hydrolase lipase domain-containing protein n=1 Tax=Oleoguttula mirabilis TaxID=1507867 RepID=A0AAV9JKG5_9PEZI|nr:hypothetical protein LTR36_002723 [Oleoguttula mirabilis]